MDQPPIIILIGTRKRAIAAAKSLGLIPITIDVKARREQTPQAYGGTIHWAVQEATHLCGSQTPIGVLAVATGSVTAAAAIREHYQLPGISQATATRCHDKLAMKKAIAAAQIPCANWLETTDKTTPQHLIQTLGLPVVLKLPISSGGRGVWICKTETEIQQHLKPNLLAEAFTTGTEMSIETFRSNHKTLLINPTQYLKPGWANILPADLPTELLEEIKSLTEKVHRALDIQTGISHMEIFLTKNGPIFGEIAARPPGGYIMELLKTAYKFNPWKTLIKLATNQPTKLPTTHQQHAGVYLIHPTPGTIQSIKGLTEATNLPHIKKITCNLKPGDQIQTRQGTGQTKGKILATAPTHNQTKTALTTAHQTLKITTLPISNGDQQQS